jgi:hypothetical protein
MGCMTRELGLIPGGGRDFSLHHSTETSSGTRPASSPVGAEVSSPGVEQPEHEADPLPPFSAEVKNVWSYITTSLCVFMALYLIN